MLNKIFPIISVILFYTSTVFSQGHGKMKPMQKMEELKKIKLIEVLQMDEETSIKFFTRRAEHMRRIEEITESSKNKIDQINGMIEDKNESKLKKSIDEYMNMQDTMIKERQNFLKSASEILTTQQMAKLLVFEERFRSEVSELLFHERFKKPRNE